MPLDFPQAAKVLLPFCVRASIISLSCCFLHFYAGLTWQTIALKREFDEAIKAGALSEKGRGIVDTPSLKAELESGVQVSSWGPGGCGGRGKGAWGRLLCDLQLEV